MLLATRPIGKWSACLRRRWTRKICYRRVGTDCNRFSAIKRTSRKTSPGNKLFPVFCRQPSGATKANMFCLSSMLATNESIRLVCSQKSSDKAGGFLLKKQVSLLFTSCYGDGLPPCPAIPSQQAQERLAPGHRRRYHQTCCLCLTCQQ